MMIENILKIYLQKNHKDINIKIQRGKKIERLHK